MKQENQDMDIVTLKISNGQFVEFDKIAVIEFDKILYVILKNLSTKEIVVSSFEALKSAENQDLIEVKDEFIKNQVLKCYNDFYLNQDALKIPQFEFKNREEFNVVEPLINQINQRDEKAIEKLIDLTYEGNAISCFILGYCYLYGILVEQSKNQAIEYYEKASRMGQDIAQLELGDIYYDGIIVNKNKKIAFDYYSKSAEADNKVAEYKLGLMYVTADNVDFDLTKGLELIERSAQQGYVEAQVKLAQINLLKKDRFGDIKALFWFEEAKKSNNALACYYLGEMYFSGRGSEMNLKKALQNYNLAKEFGFIKAQEKIDLINKLNDVAEFPEQIPYIYDVEYNNFKSKVGKDDTYSFLNKKGEEINVKVLSMINYEHIDYFLITTYKKFLVSKYKVPYLDNVVIVTYSKNERALKIVKDENLITALYNEYDKNTILSESEKMPTNNKKDKKMLDIVTMAIVAVACVVSIFFAIKAFGGGNSTALFNSLTFCAIFDIPILILSLLSFKKVDNFSKLKPAYKVGLILSVLSILIVLFMLLTL